MKELNAVGLSPQTLSILTNWILHSCRFGMMEELRQDGPVWGLAKALGESVAGWFGHTPTWEHCQTQLKRAVTQEQFTAIYQELHWLEIDWLNFSGSIGVFSGSHDPARELAYKIKTLKAITQSRIDSYKQGAIRSGNSGDAFHSYKNQMVTELSPVVWGAFVAALDRLEEMRLARLGAKKVLPKAVALLEHKQIQGEFDRLQLLDDSAFHNVRARHWARRQMPARNESLSIILLIALLGSLGSFVAGMFSRDADYFFGAIFWLIVGTATYCYLAVAAKYWREHYAIIAEEVRRFGRASFS